MQRKVSVMWISYFMALPHPVNIQTLRQTISETTPRISLFYLLSAHHNDFQIEWILWNRSDAKEGFRDVNSLFYDSSTSSKHSDVCVKPFPKLLQGSHYFTCCQPIIMAISESKEASFTRGRLYPLLLDCRRASSLLKSLPRFFLPIHRLLLGTLRNLRSIERKLAE